MLLNKIKIFAGGQIRLCKKNLVIKKKILADSIVLVATPFSEIV
jgi:hypothetical protein